MTPVKVTLSNGAATTQFGKFVDSFGNVIPHAAIFTSQWGHQIDWFEVEYDDGTTTRTPLRSPRTPDGGDIGIAL